MALAAANPFRAIALKLGSITVFVAMAALIKAASDEVPPGEAVFFRSAFAIPVILVWLAIRGDLARALRTRNPLGHIGRGVIGTLGMGLFFTGLAILPLSEVQAIQYVTPILVLVLAAVFLGERIRLVRIAAVTLGMAGVLVILWPRLTAFTAGDVETRLAMGALIVLAGAACAAAAQILIRRLVVTEETSAIVFWFSVTSACLALLTFPFGWVVPSGPVAAMLVLSGLLGGLGQILLTSAYRFADASVIAPFDYTSMLLALTIGYAAFGEVPTVTMLAGAGLVIAAGVLIIWRERQLGLQRGKARPNMTPQG